jgi:DNA-binding response OmpR family regulator
MPDPAPDQDTDTASEAGRGVLLATDADWIADEVDAALSTPDLPVRRVRAGRDVLAAVAAETPALVVLDLQIGNMGGMATCLSLRLEAGAGRLPEVPVLMLLDREADVFLARRSESQGWLIKPIDAFRLRRAAAALTSGGTFQEGVASEPVAVGGPGSDSIDDSGK